MLKSQAENFVMFLRAMRVWSFSQPMLIAKIENIMMFLRRYESLEFSHQCLNQAENFVRFF